MKLAGLSELANEGKPSQRSSKHKYSSLGFTLTELLIVLVILGILAGIAIPKYMSSTTKAKQTEAKELLHQIYLMEQSYFLEHDEYWIPGDGVEASKDTPYAFDRIGVEIGSSARYSYHIEETENGFRAVATATTLDDDPAEDIWMIDQSGALLAVSDDSVER